MCKEKKWRVKQNDSWIMYFNFNGERIKWYNLFEILAVILLCVVCAACAYNGLHGGCLWITIMPFHCWKLDAMWDNIIFISEQKMNFLYIKRK